VVLPLLKGRYGSRRVEEEGASIEI